MAAKSRSPWRTLLCAAGVSAMVSCSDEMSADSQPGCTETINCRVTGYVYNPGGSPAVGAAVRLYRLPGKETSAVPQSAIDSTLTGSDGGYRLSADLFDSATVVAAGDSGSAYRRAGTSDHTGPLRDTLRAPGRIRGVVRLQPFDDSRTVLVLVLGTGYWTAPTDRTGNFTLTGIPAAHLPVRFITTLDSYEPFDTTLTAYADSEAVLADTIRLHYRGLAKPQVFTGYDSAGEVVSLSWRLPTGASAAAYNVYRRDIDSAVARRVSSAPISDTMYLDSTAVENRTYRYSVAAVDRWGEESRSDESEPISVSSVFVFEKEFGQGILQGLGGMEFDEGGNLLVCDRVMRCVFVFDSGGSLLSRLPCPPPSIPGDLACGDGGSVFIGDAAGARILQLDSQGQVIRSITGLDSPLGDGLENIRSVAYAGGRILATVAGGRCSFRAFDSLGNSLSCRDCGGDPACCLVNPTGIAVSRSTGSIYVCDFSDNSVHIFTADSRPMARLTVPEPVSVALDLQDSALYVASCDQSKPKVIVADLHDSTFARFGTAGDIRGGFVSPECVTIARDGRAFVSDGRRNLILVFRKR